MKKRYSEEQIIGFLRDALIDWHPTRELAEAEAARLSASANVEIVTASGSGPRAAKGA